MRLKKYDNFIISGSILWTVQRWLPCFWAIFKWLFFIDVANLAMAEFQIKTLLLQPEKRPSMCKTPDTLFESPNTDLEPGKPGLTEWCPMVLDKSFRQMNTYKVQQSEYGASCYPEALTLSWRFGWSDTLPRHLSLVLIRHPSVLKRPEMLAEEDCCLLNQGKISAEPLKIL